MSGVRASKHDLKVQREALARYERYLPTLRLKQRQLQVEVRRVDRAVEAASAEEEDLRRALSRWIELWAEAPDVGSYLALETLALGETSVAGVTLPTLERLAWWRAPRSPRATPPWLDDAVAALEALGGLTWRRRLLSEQRSLLGDELRRTVQRVNLFEKVRIPAAQAALRTIRIALGEQQAAEVVRAKLAKAKLAQAKLAKAEFAEADLARAEAHRPAGTP